MKTGLYVALLAVSLVAAVGAILTLVPTGGASYPNVLGYQSFCTFAPAATLYCAFIAGVTCVLRASLVKRRALYGKSTIKAAPLAILGFILALAVASSVWFVAIDSRYPDSASGATALAS